MKADQWLAVPQSMIPPEPVIPLWPGWVPRRHATMVAAPCGTGKGLWTIDMAARVSTGRPWPGETEWREPEAVVLIAREDDPNEAVAWRLQAAEADPSLVFNLTELPDGSLFTVPDSMEVLRDAVKQIEEETKRRVGLVIVDPLHAVVKVKLPGRAEWEPLEGFARQHGHCAVVVPHHVTKAGTVAGLKELTNAARHVLRIDRPDKSSPVRVVSVEKSNMGDDTIQVQYALADTANGTPRVVYATDQAPEQAEVPQRSYTIRPVTIPAVPPAMPPLKKKSWQMLLARQDSAPEKLGDGYDDMDDARGAAEEHAGHALPWKKGDHGSLYASTLLKGGKVAAYTVFPNTV